MQVAFLGDVNTHTVYSGGCDAKPDDFHAVGSRVDFGNYKDVIIAMKTFNGVFRTRGWVPHCSNSADFNTFLGEDLVVHKDGTFCVGKSGYYRIHSVMQSHCSDNCSRKVKVALYVKTAGSFKYQNTDDLAGSMAEYGAHADSVAGSQIHELDTTLPLRKGQCFYINDFTDSVSFPAEGLRAPHIKQDDDRGIPEIGNNFIQVHRLYRDGCEGTFA